MIEVKDLTCRTLKNVTFTVPHGGLCLLLGANGSGKSTLLSVLARLIKPESGSVVTSDRPNLLIQDSDYALFGQTPLEELLLPYPDPDAKTRCSAQGLLSRFCLDPLARVSDLSFGQRRKLALLTTFFPPSAVVLFDEPTSGLDWPGIKELIATLKELRVSRTMMIATHEADAFLPLLKNGDCVVILYEGNALFYPTPNAARCAVASHPEYGIRPF